MAIKFQYNKTSLTEMGKQLKVRQRALPTLQNKESALRLEVRKAKADSERLISELEDALQRYDYLAALWNEFEPGLIAITDVDLYTKKVAGVKTPALGEICPGGNPLRNQALQCLCQTGLVRRRRGHPQGTEPPGH